MGRTAIPKEYRNDKDVHIRFTESAYSGLSAYALAHDVTVGQLCRWAALQALKTERLKTNEEK